MTAISSTEPLRIQLKVDSLRQAQLIYPLELRHSQKNVNMIAFNATETLMAACTADCLVNVYNALNFKLINQFRVGVALKYLCFSRSDLIVAGSVHTFFYVLDPFEPQEVVTEDPDGDASARRLGLEPREATISAVEVSPMDKHLAVLYDDRSAGQAVFALYNFAALSPTTTTAKLPAALLGDTTGLRATKFKFFLSEDCVVCAQSGKIWRGNIAEGKLSEEASLALPDGRVVRSMTFSPRFDFLLLSCMDGVLVIDPLALSVLRSFDTQYPVCCAQLSALAYAPNPRFHLVYGGGIEAIHQASSSKAGNQVLIQDLATEERIGELKDFYACINWVLLFKDGSGFITAGEEGACRVYRFDASYYDAGGAELPEARAE